MRAKRIRTEPKELSSHKSKLFHCDDEAGLSTIPLRGGQRQMASMHRLAVGLSGQGKAVQNVLDLSVK
jgi:hypothetical protein